MTPQQITWLDIHASRETWLTEGEAAELRPLTMTTIGWIVRECRDWLTVCSTISNDGQLMGDVNCIPRGCILTVMPLDAGRLKEP